MIKLAFIFRFILLFFIMFFAFFDFSFAQNKHKQGLITAPAINTFAKPWLKNCIREGEVRTVCVTSQNLFLGDGQKLASIGVQVDSSNDKISLLASVPAGIRIKPGIMVFVNEKSVKLDYSLCVNNFCEAFLETDQDFIDYISKAKLIDLTYIAFNGQRIRVTMKMEHFTETFNGEPQRVQNSIMVKRK